jgi:hypothetical protein
MASHYIAFRRDKTVILASIKLSNSSKHPKTTMLSPAALADVIRCSRTLIRWCCAFSDLCVDKARSTRGHFLVRFFFVHLFADDFFIFDLKVRAAFRLPAT